MHNLCSTVHFKDIRCSCDMHVVIPDIKAQKHKHTVRILKTSCKTNGTSSCNTQLYSSTCNKWTMTLQCSSINRITTITLLIWKILQYLQLFTVEKFSSSAVCLFTVLLVVHYVISETVPNTPVDKTSYLGVFSCITDIFVKNCPRFIQYL